jgi:hypothetical protein
MSPVFVVIEFTTFWMHSTGAGGGVDVDLVADRDSDGFPVLRGRHVRGVLREASRRVEMWSSKWGASTRIWDSAAKGAALTDLLFGTRTQLDGIESTPGCLDIRDFHIPENAKSSTGGTSIDRELAPMFFRRIAATAIDPRGGAAKDKTLRAIEAGAPCPVGGWIAWSPHERLVQKPDDEAIVQAAATGTPAIWRRHLERCLVEARSFGANRARGYGRTRFAVDLHMIEGDQR